MLMENGISLIGRSERICGMSSNMMLQLPPKPLRQEAFEDLVMNFILDQEEKVKQFEEYMDVIGSDFMQLSFEVVEKLKDEIRAEENRVKKNEKITRNTKGQSSTSREVSLEERIRGFRIFKNGVPEMLHGTLATRPIHPENVIPAIILMGDSSRASNPILSPALNGRTYSELTNVYDPEHKGVKLRLGEERKISLLELGWRIGLYSEDQSREDNTRTKLNKEVTVKEMRLLIEFWPSIRDGEFIMGNISVNKVRDPRVKLAHRCIATTFFRRKDSIQRITDIDLFYLYCIYTPGVVFNIPYWLAKYLKGVMEKNVISGGMFVTRIGRSYRLLTSEMMDALSVEHRPHVFKKKSLITMGIVMKIHGGACYWHVIREAEGDDEAEEATEGGVGGSANAYKDMSRGDW
nr:hypothetical protein [Tanacetum cinerariifolium]